VYQAAVVFHRPTFFFSVCIILLIQGISGQEISDIGDLSTGVVEISTTTIPVENARVTGQFLHIDGKPVSPPIEAHTEKEPGVYGVHYTFDDDGDYKLVFAAVTEDGVQVRADFPIPVSAAPINYRVFILDGLFLLLGLGFLRFSHVGAQKRFRNSRAALQRLAPQAAVTATLVAASILTIHYFMPTTQARAETEGLGITGATDTSEVIIPKESQILFGIRTMEVQPAKIISGVTANGLVRVRPQFKAEVVPPVSGRTRWRSRRVTVGDFVRAGETIAVVEQILSAPEVASLEATRTDLKTKGKQLQSEAIQAKQRLDLAKIELERSRRLYEVGAAPLKRMQDAELAVKLAEEQYAAAQKQAEITEVGEQRVNPVRTFPLQAPISGIITQVNFTPGQQVEAGASLFTIMDLSRVWIEAKIYEKDLAVVTNAKRATFKVAAFPNEVFTIENNDKGKLLTVSPVVDPQTRTLSVIYEVTNPGGQLRDGMFAEITIDTTGDREVLAVPKEAVVDDQGKKIVYVFVGGERFEKRTVTLGAQGQTMIEMTSGLKPGERVVTRGIYQLRSVASGRGS
jgi:RND family efflux transporter MFP subunit